MVVAAVLHSTTRTRCVGATTTIKMRKTMMTRPRAPRCEVQCRMKNSECCSHHSC